MHDHDDMPNGISRRAVLKAAIGVGTGAAAASAGAYASVPALATDMARAASAWLGSLTDRQRQRTQFAWTDARRDDWDYPPRTRPGVTLGEMSDAQSAATWDLLGTLLSARGLELARGQLMVERILGELTNNPGFRDPGNYALVLFGDPDGSAPWSWRLEGHHLVLNTVILPDHGIAVTPNFFGANPARVPAGHHHHGFRLLGAEEDAAFGLIRSVDDGLRRQIMLSDRSLGNIVSGPGREDILQSFEGAPLSRLNEAQKDGVMHILELYATALRPEVAGAAMARIRDTGVDALHFAWAGSLAPGKPHYFRIHGPAALLEYDNTQNGANHVHSVWIDPQGLFGRDLLKRHYHDAH